MTDDLLVDQLIEGGEVPALDHLLDHSPEDLLVVGAHRQPPFGSRGPKLALPISPVHATKLVFRSGAGGRMLRPWGPTPRSAPATESPSSRPGAWMSMRSFARPQRQSRPQSPSPTCPAGSRWTRPRC